MAGRQRRIDPKQEDGALAKKSLASVIAASFALIARGEGLATAHARTGARNNGGEILPQG